MNQPKFKFGDKVEYGNNLGARLTFSIARIKYSLGGYFYSDSSLYTEWYAEEFIGLYQEPQKKMLYAYDLGFEGIRFYPSDVSNIVRYRGDMPVRAPEYDIEYPRPLNSAQRAYLESQELP